MTVTAGIDIGSTYVKVVVMKDGRRMGYDVGPTGAYPDNAAMACLKNSLEKAGLSESDVDYTVSTGYGRRIASFSDANISEISANARGSKFIGERFGIRTIIDIGGQDTKVISLDESCNMVNFAMNDKCAAGTGRFLEMLAKVLEVPLDQMGPISLTARDPVEITTTCLVFAKSEVATHLAEGEHKEDIIQGIHTAIARRLIVMAKKVGIREKVFFDGGPARNIGMVETFKRELNMEIVVPEIPQIVTATGAAVIAAEIVENGTSNVPTVPAPGKSASGGVLTPQISAPAGTGQSIRDRGSIR
ncbi:MAG: acyl-CoA dehydratase activase [Thermoplasmatota archaeon]